MNNKESTKPHLPLWAADLSKAYQRLEEKAVAIYSLSGYTLDDIIELLRKGFTFAPPEPSNALAELKNYVATDIPAASQNEPVTNCHGVKGKEQ